MLNLASSLSPRPMLPVSGAGNCMRAEGPEIYQAGASPQILVAGEVKG